MRDEKILPNDCFHHRPLNLAREPNLRVRVFSIRQSFFRYYFLHLFTIYIHGTVLNNKLLCVSLDQNRKQEERKKMLGR